MDPQALFLSNLPTIERIVATIGRRHAFPADDQEELASYVKLRLIEHDYAVLAKFQGRSSLTTYLNVVITNCFRDFRTARWGRWRPSAEARRLGPLALRLECLLYRDGYAVREAIEKLRAAGDHLPADAELARLAARIPARSRPRTVTSAAAEEITAADVTDAEVARQELDESRTTTMQEVERALASLAPEDQLIVRMRYFDAMSVADIARTLRLDQKPLYRRIENSLSRLRVLLEQRGIDRTLVAAFLSE
jgi:RNA polymerase sigma factor for flagellar operon FliA